MRYFGRVLTAVLVVAAMTTVGASKAQADFLGFIWVATIWMRLADIIML